MIKFQIGDRVQNPHYGTGTIILLYTVINNSCTKIEDTIALVKWDNGTQFSVNITNLTEEPYINVGDKLMLDDDTYEVLDIISHENKLFYKLERNQQTHIPNVSLKRQALENESTIRAFKKI